MEERKVWSWRHAVQQSEIQSTTKLVLLNLSIYMNELGQDCFPSTKRQAKDTSLSEKAVCEHLDKAESFGFIKRSKHGFSGQGWSRNQYTAMYPEGTYLRSAPEEKALTLTEEGTYPDGEKALTVGKSNSSLNSSKNSQKGKAKIKAGGKGDFCEEWSEDVLPYEWQDHAERIGLKDDRVFQSWRKFKDMTDWPMKFSRWKAWAEREKI